MIIILSFCFVLAGCAKDSNTHNNIDDSFPTNEFSDVIFCTSDGSNCLFVESKEKQIETKLVLVNLSEYEVYWETSSYVRLQKKVDGVWVFADDNPYTDLPSVGTMMSVLPQSLYGEILATINIDPGTFDFSAEYRFYLPIFYRAAASDSNENTNPLERACIAAEVTIETKW